VQRSLEAAETDVEALARQILDDSKSNKDREAIIAAHSDESAALIAAMARDVSGEKEEYRRIPWIWRVAIAAGRRNDRAEIRRILVVALPKPNEPLRHWQAVVLGGGMINGISLRGQWPSERIGAIIQGDAELQSRLNRSIALAQAMADNETVPTGTRYDALRILGIASFDRFGGQLFRYLLKGVDPELQQGAIGALCDMRSHAVGQALLSGWDHYSQGNRKFVVEGLLREEARRSTLLDAIESGRLRNGDIDPELAKRIMESVPPSRAERVRKALRGSS
jgi:hypothetical protein